MSESRLTGRELQRIRASWFRRYPLCAECERHHRARVAVELDHIVALSNGGLDFDEDAETNRQGLCKLCHDVKTALDLGHRIKTENDVDGMPLNEDHPWNIR